MSDNTTSRIPGSSGTDNQEELGFGSKVYEQHVRLLNPDGSFNVTKTGRSWWRPYDFYHSLISMSWARFLGLTLLGYFVVNLVFSLIYLGIGMEHLAGTVEGSTFDKWLDAFFFSSQTVTTLGYGRISPVGTAASTVAALESMIGLLGFALATGLFYGRFSRPVAKVRFSDVAVIAPFEDGHAFMIRLANERSSQLIDVSVRVIYSWIDPAIGKRQFTYLDLQIQEITFLSLSWTVVHPINETSPLYGLQSGDIEAKAGEFIVLIKGFEDAFGAQVYAQASYTAKELAWNRSFKSVIGTEGGSLRIEMDKLSELN